MGRVEIEINIERIDSDDAYEVTGSITVAGETTEIHRYFSGGNSIFPIYLVLRDEISTIKESEIYVQTNSRNFHRELNTLDKQCGTLAVRLKEVLQANCNTLHVK
ncbi:hypothetical protein [Sporosarcina sp. OR05]|uniref:hypothetical protein n=1 Tax=Sporosarcina sp. OR05 TaxID=2969819 RepID=UPI00352B5DAD